MPGLLGAVRSGLRSVGWGFGERAAAAGAKSSLMMSATNRMANMGNTALSASMGGLAGGVYGAFDDDTSILEGAFIGAGLGMGTLAGHRLGKAGLGAYRSARGLGAAGQQMMGPVMPRGQALGRAFTAMADETSNFIGNTIVAANKALNPILGRASTVAGRAAIKTGNQMQSMAARLG